MNQRVCLLLEVWRNTLAVLTIFKTESFKLVCYMNQIICSLLEVWSQHSCRITIDTGSNISIIRPDVLSEQEQMYIQPVSQSIRTVTGEKAPVQGKGDLHRRIRTAEAVHPMWNPTPVRPFHHYRVCL